MSMPMTCNKDLIFNILYLKNEQVLYNIVQNSLKALDCPWKCSKLSLDVNQILFFLLLHKDIQLKKNIIEGFKCKGIDPMNHRKAEKFFLAIEEEVINPWLCNEKLTNTHFLEKVSALYWSC